MIRAFAVLFLFSIHASALTMEKYVAPKLVVMLVIDQFRGDYLTRFEKQFLPAGTAAQPGGFRFLMKNGAWFPFAQYDSLQNMTCPGHATIATGSHPATFGFSTNDWYDSTTKKKIYCADDPVHGLSPMRLKTTTVADELKSIQPKAKAIAVALKDRSAIMLAGHRADMAIWMEEKTERWGTSSYYNKGQLPVWAQNQNKLLTKGYSEPTVESGRKGTKATFDLALAAVKAEKLGRGPHSDFLAISLSNHDMVGHAVGPNSKIMEDLTLAEDKALSEFLRALSQELKGLDSVVIALSADHGIPPNPIADSPILPSGKLDFLDATKKISQALDKKFGSSGKSAWIESIFLYHFHLNEELIKDKKANRHEVEDEVRRILLEEKGILTAFTRTDFEKGTIAPTPEGAQFRRSYVPANDGDVVAIPQPFYAGGGKSLVTHITGYSYDRVVPVLIFGKPVKPGVYSGAHIVDIAPTLSFILRILPPARSEGRVLDQIF